MPHIEIRTEIAADIETCFDLARNIDIHKESLKHTDEIPISGKTTGLIEKGEWVSWEARHFGFVQHLSTKVTELEFPNYFALEMVLGAFKSYKHQHIFETSQQVTIMTDKLVFESPMGILGNAVNVLILKRYMVKLLKTRNTVIKNKAEDLFRKQQAKALTPIL